MRLVITAALAATPLFAGAAAAECSVPHFRFFANVQVDAMMTASSGQNCSITLRAHERSRFDKIAVVSRPRHGTASVGVGGGMTYRSIPGYSGEDAFVFSVSGQMRSGRGTARIRVKVSVLAGGFAAANVPDRASTRSPLLRLRSPGPNAQLRDVYRRCRRTNGAYYDWSRRGWYIDNRYANFFLDCIARGTGAAPTSSTR